MNNVKFEENELKITGSCTNVFQMPGFLYMPKLNTPITQKENFEMFLNKKVPYWMPLYSDIQSMRPRIMPDNVVCGLVQDGEEILGPKDFSGKGWFDLDWIYVETVGGATVKPGNPKVKDISKWKEVIEFPNINSYDWENSAKANKNWFDKGRLLECCMLCGFWERLISLMDVENAAIALIDEDEKEYVHDLFDELCNLYDKVIDKFKTYYNPDIILMHDDWGTQNSTFFSSDTLKEMILPYMKRIVDSCHRRGMKFQLHSCGKIEKFVPYMVEIGIDMWWGQDLNDIATLSEKYGENLAIIVISPVILPTMSDEEVKQLTQDFFNKYKNLRVFVLSMTSDERFLKELYKLSREYYSDLKNYIF